MLLKKKKHRVYLQSRPWCSVNVSGFPKSTFLEDEKNTPSIVLQCTLGRYIALPMKPLLLMSLVGISPSCHGLYVFALTHSR